MAQAAFWIFPQTGDPTPQIGCGLRRVFATVGPKWVRIEYGERRFRIPRRRWELLVPNVEDTGQELKQALFSLRRWRGEGEMKPVRRKRKR